MRLSRIITTRAARPISVPERLFEADGQVASGLFRIPKWYGLSIQRSEGQPLFLDHVACSL